MIQVPNEIFNKWAKIINGILHNGWCIYGDEAIIGLVKKEKCSKCLQII